MAEEKISQEFRLNNIDETRSYLIEEINRNESKCAVCDSKKSKLIKQQETSGLLSSLGVKTPLSKIPLVGTLLF